MKKTGKILLFSFLAMAALYMCGNANIMIYDMWQTIDGYKSAFGMAIITLSVGFVFIVLLDCLIVLYKQINKNENENSN